MSSREVLRETKLTFNQVEGQVDVGRLGIGGLSPHMIAIDLVGHDFYWWLVEDLRISSFDIFGYEEFHLCSRRRPLDALAITGDRLIVAFSDGGSRDVQPSSISTHDSARHVLKVKTAASFHAARRKVIQASDEDFAAVTGERAESERGHKARLEALCQKLKL